jgi:hypothetical protein
MKPKYLWHGSPNKLEILEPSNAVDLSGHPDSNQNGVYATDLKELAIEFGLIDKKYQKFADYSKEPVQMVLINGEIRNGKVFYLYKLLNKNFKEMPEGSHQWVSLKSEKPIEVIELNVDDYKHLVRVATKKDIDLFNSLIGKFS